MKILSNLFEVAKHCLDCSDPTEKIALSKMARECFVQGKLNLESSGLPVPVLNPGRPPLPRLIAPRHLPKRTLNSLEGRACFLHAIAHIEFNAINLAWDAVYRFCDMPPEFYDSWVNIAAEEAYHFELLAGRLKKLGYCYGDFDAHNGLWEMAVKTANSCLARMALVPRVLEARGLDVTPGMIERLKSVGDHESVAILEIILKDEITHVAAGSRWFSWCCEKESVDPRTAFQQLLDKHNIFVSIRGPHNVQARLEAGFSPEELHFLATRAA